jgi:hypothetical protein
MRYAQVSDTMLHDALQLLSSHSENNRIKTVDMETLPRIYSLETQKQIEASV